MKVEVPIQKPCSLEVLVPHIIKPKNYGTKIDYNNSRERLNLLFNDISIKMILNMQKEARDRHKAD